MSRFPRRSRVLFGCALIGSTLWACGTDGDPPATDAAVGEDAMVIEEPFLPWPEDAPPVDLPSFLPCPAGWSELDDGDVITCTPFAAGIGDTCGPGQAHFPGQGGCSVVGEVCPAGPFADSTAATEITLYVDPEAAPGGDGSRSSPYRLLSEVAWPSLFPGTTIMLAKGEFIGTVVLPSDVHLVGACASETIMVGLDSPTLGVVMTHEAGAAASVRNLTIRGRSQGGISVESGAHLDVSGVVVDGAQEIGVYAGDAGSRLTLREVVIRNTRSNSVGRDGRGLAVQYGARVDGTMVIIDGNHDGGVFIGEAGSEVSLEDSVIANTQGQEVNGYSGRGVGVQDGGRFVATRTLIYGNRELGVFAGRDGSEVILTDVIIAGTLPQGGGADNFGRGIAIQDGAHIAGTRLVVEGNHDAALAIASPRTTAVLVDAVVRDTEPELRTGGFGRGINVQDGSQLNATRLLVANNHNVGLVISGAEANSVLEDVTILDTQVDAAQGDRGYGVHVQLEATVQARGLAIRGSRTLGIAGIHSTMDLEDVVVHRTEAATCTRSTCNETPFGYGVAAISSAVRMTSFVISEADTCGVFLAGDVGTLDLRRGVVTGANFGACVQVADYDFARLTDGVAYVDNIQNLEATSLPVPGPVVTARTR